MICGWVGEYVCTIRGQRSILCVSSNHSPVSLLRQGLSLNLEVTELYKSTVLVRVSISEKRHHDQGNCYKGKHLIGIGLQIQRFSLLLWQEAWWQAGRHDTGEGAENSTSGSTGNRNRETLGLAWAIEIPKPNPSDILPPTMPYLVQQGYTS